MGSSTTGAKEDLQPPEAPVADDHNNNTKTKENMDDEEAIKPQSAHFKEGEKVLAYHGPLIYEAKVQRAEFRKKEWKYYVHYLGWSKNWDEWVGADRLMHFTEENVQKQQELLKNQSGDKSFKGRVSQSKPRSSTDVKVEKEDVKNYVAKGKKRKGDYGVEEKDGESPEKVVKIQLPTTLKKQLVDDSEFVTHLGKLVRLPRNPTVDDILKKYLEHKTKKENTSAVMAAKSSLALQTVTQGLVGNHRVDDSVVEILSGLRNYFDKALPAMLLYKQERQQYSEAVPERNNVAPSSVYGAEHFLRLFVKLPELLVYVNMEEEALTQLQEKLLDFLKFLQKNQSNFFLSNYDGPKVPPEVEKRDQIGS